MQILLLQGERPQAGVPLCTWWLSVPGTPFSRLVRSGIAEPHLEALLMHLGPGLDPPLFHLGSVVLVCCAAVC